MPADATQTNTNGNWSSTITIANGPTNYTFHNSKSTVSARTWTATFTVDVSTVQLTTTSQGCKNFDADPSQVLSAAFPVGTVVPPDQQYTLVDRVHTIVYTSGGQTYTLTQTTGTPDSQACGTMC